MTTTTRGARQPQRIPTPPRIGYPAPEHSRRRLAVAALLATLILLLLMVGGISLLLYFSADLLEFINPSPIVRAPGI